MKTFQKFREINEGITSTSDYKLDKSGRKYPAHRVTLGLKTDLNVNNTDANTDVDVTESYNPNFPKDPPFVLVLKREAIRYYPNNTKVALYYNAKLDKHFSVPYGPEIAPASIQSEETEDQSILDESVLDTLHKITKDKAAQRVKFENGKTRKIDHFTASAVIGLHDALSNENKVKLHQMVNKSPEHLMKAVELAMKHVK